VEAGEEEEVEVVGWVRVLRAFASTATGVRPRPRGDGSGSVTCPQTDRDSFQSGFNRFFFFLSKGASIQWVGTTTAWRRRLGTIK
jgi:hypothetical protein